MTFGINGAELIILVLLAVLVLGPEKLPEYTRKLTEWIRNLRAMAEGAKSQFKEETGTDFDEIDWRRYDPRQYDPRRIIREALSEPVGDAEDTGRGARASGAGSTAALDAGTRESLRKDLDAVRSERESLREDLQEMDPRALFFGSSGSRRSTAAPEADVTPAGRDAPDAAEPLDAATPAAAPAVAAASAAGPDGVPTASAAPASAAPGAAAARPAGTVTGTPSGERPTPFDPEAT